MPRDGPDGAALDAAEILEQLATSVLVVSARDGILWLNAAALDLFALSPAAALGRPIGALVADGAELEALIARSRDGNEPVVLRGLELTLAARADLRYEVDVAVTPFGERLLIEIADATRPSRMSRDSALLVQQGGSRVMARQLAHEIKNPLGGLRGAAQLLERELPSEELKEYTRVIIGEADRLRALVDSLLGPGRAIRRERINVHELLDRVFRLARAEAPAGIAIERDYDPSLPALSLDRDLMVQAMLNLARNAVQALGGRGVVTFRTRALRQATIGTERHRLVASLQFEDNGPGVPAELGETIFYPLVTGRAGGSGLGLPVAQDIATRHGGIIEFESRPGRTVFTLLLPMENGHDEAA